MKMVRNNYGNLVRFVEKIHSLIKDCKTQGQVIRKLNKSKYKEVGSGLYKTVFTFEGMPWVVKVFNDDDGFELDEGVSGLIPPAAKKYWLPYAYISKQFVLQPLLDCTNSFPKKLLRKTRNFKGCDSHSGNVGYYRGRAVIIDF